MIYFFAGDDAKTKIEVYEKFKKSLPENMAVFFISKNNFDPLQVESFYSGAGLFFSKCAVFFEHVFEKEENSDFILEKLELMEKSQNDFIFLEGKSSKAILDAFKKVRAELNVFELSKEKKEKYDNFLLADAFRDRDKLRLWIYFRQAIDLGVSLEELIGVLFWRTKDMLQRRNFSKFTEEELKNFATKLSYIVQEARENRQDDETSLEQFLLEAF